MLVQLLVLGTRVTLGSAREQHWNPVQAKFHYPTTLINYDNPLEVDSMGEHWMTTVPEIQEPAITYNT